MLDARQVAGEVERAVGADARAGVVRVVEVAAVEPPRRARLPVGAEDLFTPIDLHGFLRLVVVAGRVGDVRQGIGLQDRQPWRIEPAGRDAAEDAAVLEAAAGVARGAGQAGGVVANQVVGPVVVVDRLREVTEAFELGRHLDPVRVGRRDVAALVLVGEEEEQPVAVLVVAAERNRAADGEAGVGLAVDRLESDLRVRVGLQRPSTLTVVDEAVGVERFLPAVSVDRAAVVAAAALGDERHLGARRPAVLGRVGVGQDLELLDRVEVDRAEDAVVAGVDVADAVDGVVHGVVAAAVHVHAHAAAGRVRDAGRQARQHQGVAAVDGQVLDGRRIDRKAAFGAARLHFDDAGADGHRLGDRAELERDHAERQAVRGVDDDVGPFNGLERVHRHLEVVGIRQQVQEHEVAGLVGRRHLRVVAPRAGQLDRRSRHRRALPVPHRAGDRTARGLRHGA